ncbi:NACHT domain-containing protein [Streptomyces sp. B1-3]|uniref:NACHT domain-containing protein n=1 Tax=Streptomyces sp. B1-3 TaxID=3141453 RepID=UPI003D28BD61
MSDGHATHPVDWRSIRSWAGSQDRAFEELCFQLREPARPGWRTIKTAAPDGGVEWYNLAPDGRAHGFQVKYVHEIDDLLPLARKSLEAVGKNRPRRNVTRMVFMVCIDLPDPAHLRKGKPVVGARQRWEQAVAGWKTQLEGTSDIEVELLGSGELLERLLAPGNEGRLWVFFEKHALGAEWLKEQFERAARIAHDRYTPQHHIPLPIASTLDACAMAGSLVEHVGHRVETVHTGVSEARFAWQSRSAPAQDADAGQLASVAAKLEGLLARLERIADELHQAVESVTAAGLPADRMALAAEEASGLVFDVQEAQREWLDLAGDDEMDRATRDALRLLLLALDRLSSLCRSDQARAAEAKAWVLLGEAGQGKTHLLVDATRRALEAGRPAVTVFGELMAAEDPLTEIARQLGLGDVPHTVLLQALDAAGAASNTRFLLMIDALNDAEEPGRWRSRLPQLWAQAAPYDHVAVVVSCRSSLKDVVLPTDVSAHHVPCTEHPGFAGHEVEALESYLQKAPSALPRTPLLAPAFSNPLFVKLYCESLEALPENQRGIAARTQHSSAVFNSFLEHRAHQIHLALHLDASERVVQRAVQELARQMGRAGREVLPQQQVREIVAPFAAHLTRWPDTLLGQMVVHGVLASERFHTVGGQPEAGYGFGYQAFSDDRIVDAMLAEHAAEVEAAASSGVLTPTSELRAWLEEASPNLVEAATVLLAERTGRELIDLLSAGQDTDATADPGGRSRFALYVSLVRTLALRDAHSVSERTAVLLDQAADQFDLGPMVLEARLGVSAQIGHLLNADHLHRTLCAMAPADRDVTWGLAVYDVLERSGALHRLLRWAEQLPAPQQLRPSQAAAGPSWTPRRAGSTVTEAVAHQPPEPEVVRLAATTLVWTLISSNRFLRDRATKALVQLLLGYPTVLTALLDRFLHTDARQVDDAYVFERLAVVAHGVVARTRASTGHPAMLADVAARLLDHVYGDVTSPAHASVNALLCDAASNVIRDAFEAGLISADDAARCAHPHACPDPGQAPDETAIEARYPSRDADDERLWGSLRASLLNLADFTTYEVKPVVSTFSQLPLTVPAPDPAYQRRHRPPVLVPDRVQAFAQSLPITVREVLGTPESVTRLLAERWQARRVLTDEQRQLLEQCAQPPTSQEQLADTPVDKDWASRWILENAEHRGWNPERFAAFDNVHGGGRGCEGHKAERVGKKYQWLGLHELVERLANHRHVIQADAGDPPQYPSAEALLLIDIDPTLPPAAHPLSGTTTSEAEEAATADAAHATFPPTALDGRWNPPPPALPAPGQLADWLQQDTGLPDLGRLAVREDDQGQQWVVLYESTVDSVGGTEGEWKGQAEQWHLIHSWLLDAAHYQPAMDFLASRTLMGRWMPEIPSRHGIYLADLPQRPHDREDRDQEMRFIDYGADTDTPTPDSASPAPQPPARPRRRAMTGGDVTQAREYLDNLLGELGYRDGDGSTRERQLHELAERWSTPDTDTTTPPPATNPREIARDSDGQPLHAVPAVQEYNWSASGHDCSLDAPVNLSLPSHQLLNGAGLRRDPANGDWYTSDGTRIVRALTGQRPTGTIDTLLARKDWLEQRLRTLNSALVLGLFGERQPRTTDLTQWREYSQTAGLQPGHGPTVQEQLTCIRVNLNP